MGKQRGREIFSSALNYEVTQSLRAQKILKVSNRLKHLDFFLLTLGSKTKSIKKLFFIRSKPTKHSFYS
jgi:hypothetical protein